MGNVLIESYGNAGPAIGSRSGNPERIGNLTIQGGFIDMRGENGIGYVTNIFLGGDPRVTELDFGTDSGRSAIVGSRINIIPVNVLLVSWSFPVIIDSSNQVTASPTSSLSLIGTYYTPSQQNNFGALPVLHLGAPSNASVYVLEVRNSKTGWLHEDIIFAPQKGWLAAVPTAGDYEVYIDSFQYCHKENPVFRVGAGESFFPDLLAPCRDDPKIALIVGLVFAGIAAAVGIGVGIYFCKTGACGKCKVKTKPSGALLKDGVITYDAAVLL
jgi:hypothetical protein